MLIIGIKILRYIPYQLDCNPKVLFFKMSFWVGVNSKNPSISGLFDQKVGVYSRKTPKTGLFTLPWALFKSIKRIQYVNIISYDFTRKEVFLDTKYFSY